jgi:osmotically-inducible protein OsmY
MWRRRIDIGYFNARVCSLWPDKKRADPAMDERTRLHVEEALHSDAIFNDEHVTVSIKNGIVTLQGIVFDDWDVRTAVRIARRIPGVRRVVTDFYVPDGT